MQKNLHGNPDFCQFTNAASEDITTFFVVIHKPLQYQEGLPQNFIVITTSEAFLKNL